MKNKISEEIAEVLEVLWTLEEQGGATRELVAADAHTDVSDKLLQQLVGDMLIALEPDGRIRLLENGRATAESIIRRHRLAERLLSDVLGMRLEEIETAACEYEHMIADGITNSICTLLGHPRLCPHGKSIPEGACCRQARDEVKPVVVSCDQLGVGETARVAYFSTKEHSRLLKLSSLGISPGIAIKLIQKWPAYVVQCEETEIALEPDVAKNIYVRQMTTE
ncbi:MAG: metal-dependent transcriptional regulator [Acidobacteriota bacterium]|jgi:DtxR family Mn-dependent transcriptional regulator|nr:metal-dependent transcriptional regulator [Acidobacteriota bacterium]